MFVGEDGACDALVLGGGGHAGAALRDLTPADLILSISESLLKPDEVAGARVVSARSE